MWPPRSHSCTATVTLSVTTTGKLNRCGHTHSTSALVCCHDFVKKTGFILRETLPLPYRSQAALFPLPHPHSRTSPCSSPPRPFPSQLLHIQGCLLFCFFSSPQTTPGLISHPTDSTAPLLFCFFSSPPFFTYIPNAPNCVSLIPIPTAPRRHESLCPFLPRSLLRWQKWPQRDHQRRRERSERGTECECE